MRGAMVQARAFSIMHSDPEYSAPMDEKPLA